MTLMEVNEKLNGRYATASKITVRKPKFLKKSRLTKEPTPNEILEIRTLRRETVLLNHDYKSMIEAKGNRLHGIKEKYETGETFYTTDGIIGTHKKDDTKKYLVYSQNIHTFKEGAKFIVIDSKGNRLTDDEYNKVIEEYGDSSEMKKYSSARQEEHGLTEEELIKQKINSVDNVAMLKGSTTDKKTGENDEFQFSNPELLKDFAKYL